MSINRYDSNTGTLTTLASGSRVWTGTKAAYDAQKAAGTLPTNAIICITDDEVDTCHYSTEETFTGMYWIDGKPIYRKVIDCGYLVNASTKTVVHNISNIDSVISSIGNCKNSAGNCVQIPNMETTIAVNKTNVSIYTSSSYSNYYCYMIIEYTKTTDG